jgi:hypothetical protein
MYSKNSAALREYKKLVKEIREEQTSHTNEGYDEGDDESVTPRIDRGAELNVPGDEDNTFEDIEG